MKNLIQKISLVAVAMAILLSTTAFTESTGFDFPEDEPSISVHSDFDDEDSYANRN